ncbi:hypothetical protein ACFVS2_26835 [Brevibacillus sp. NPDC058079]|uniref:hypothetical protein n=1 Tax=Brevibacillus sp. NPDC058079 TaxID=3346330 RepID=UPI0036E2E1F5
MDLTKALELWIEVTGISPNETKFKLRDLDIHQANEVLKKSLEYDKTYVTTLILLGRYLDEFAEERLLPLKAILKDYDTFSKWLTKIHELRSILNMNEALETKQSFKQSLKNAIVHYKVDESVIESIIEDENNLSELRFSAFRAINKLEICQFSHGSPSKNNPKIYDRVYMFKDINTLLQWMMSVDSGIVLALIQDSSQLSSSYFVFAIRNGGTLSIVTDREKTSHPLREELSRTRARGREFSKRIGQNYFPYSLMDITFGDNDRAYVNEESALATREDGVPLKEIKDLEHDEVVWLIMMFSLLSEKFFANNFKVDTLSYSAKMMQESNLLLRQAEENSIVLHNYQPLIVNKLKSEDMKTDKVKDAFQFDPTGQHDWMIERYPVPEQVFDVLGDPEVLYLTGGAEDASMSVEMRKMSPSSFASQERLQKDRIYLARYNQAKVISRQLGDEFRQREQEVMDWYRAAVKKNLPNLLKAISFGKFFVSGDTEDAYIRKGDWIVHQEDRNILRVASRKGDPHSAGWNIWCRFAGLGSDIYNPTCVVNGSQAFLFGHFYPTTARMLADICGCEVTELHELLQNWRREKINSGNHLLDSVDPMDWAIKNPWKDIRFDVRIYLSKSGFNKLCKEHRTGNEKFWLKSQDNS